MPENIDNQEVTEIQQNNTLTKQEDDVIIKRLDALSNKINDYYLKRSEPLKEDPVFELFEKMDKEKEE